MADHLIQRYSKNNKTLDLVRCTTVEKDIFGHLIVSEYWECRISDGRVVPFINVELAVIYIEQNMWSVVDL